MNEREIERTSATKRAELSPAFSSFPLSLSLSLALERTREPPPHTLTLYRRSPAPAVMYKVITNNKSVLLLYICTLHSTRGLGTLYPTLLYPALFTVQSTYFIMHKRFINNLQ